MRDAFLRILFSVLLVAAIILVPQAHAFGAMGVACNDQPAAAAAEKSADTCCAPQTHGGEQASAEIQSDRSTIPSEPCDTPCDHSCDCRCCVKTVRPAPMIVGLLPEIFSADTPTSALLPCPKRPGQVALSVPVQPPIV